MEINTNSAATDPFFDITIVTAAGKVLKLYRSEVIKGTLKPDWKAFDLSLVGLTLESLIKITCYDWDKDGSNDVSH